jgi:hypothetical protein
MRTPILAIVLLAACRAPTEAEPTAEAASADAPLPIDARDQYALLADIEGAIGSAIARDAASMAAVRANWQGHRFRWELASVPLFCRSAAACHVAPFDHARFPDRRIHQGWMPQLELDDAGFAELGRLCEGKKVCVIEVEATMRELVFDPELATAVRLADVRLVASRDGQPTESWIASRAPLRQRA